MTTLRILISSPGDVAEERTKARQVIEQLQRQNGSGLELIPGFGEHIDDHSVAGIQARTGMRLADLSEHRLDRMQIVADRAVESHLAAASALCDGHGDGVFVDIKPKTR